MPTFRRKEITVEAWRWDGDVDEVGYPSWIRDAIREQRVRILIHYSPITLLVRNAEGDRDVQLVYPEDFVVKYDNGDIKGFPHSTFYETFERA